jgi:preprotein translocase subunit SecE
LAREQGIPRRLGSEAARKAFSVRAFGDVVSELRRVTWPTREETTRLTIMVIAVAAVIGTFLGLIDLAFTRIMSFILGT